MIKECAVLLLMQAAPEFTKVEEAEGVVIEARSVTGSQLVELRLTTTTTKSPSSLCDAAFGDGKFDPAEPDLKSRKVLSESADERVTYDQIDPPAVANRDYAVRAKRFRSSKDSCRVTFEAANEVAPSKPSGWVRITKLRGEWIFQRRADGKTQVSYLVFTDPGGSIPVFMIEGNRRKFALQWMKMILSRGKEE
jgi:hypothetical protein